MLRVISGFTIAVLLLFTACEKEAVPVSPAAPPTFEVHMTKKGQMIINTLKVVRETTGLGLKECKELVDKTPVTIKKGLTAKEADALAAKLRKFGALVDNIHRGSLSVRIPSTLH